MSDEKTLNPKPSEEEKTVEEQPKVEETPTEDIVESTEATVNDDNTEEKPSNIPVEAEEVASETTEEVVEEPSEEKDEEKTSEVNYETEIVSTGPFTEEIRVYELGQLSEDKAADYDEKRSIYESSLKDISPGQRTIGTVVSVRDNDVLMDIGFKSEGFISKDEFEEGETPKPGDQIEVLVDVLEDDEGQMILSKRKADFMRVWERVRQIFDNTEIVEGKIKSRIKGGMVVDIMGIDAFLPGSQIDVRPVTDFDYYVGKSYDFRIVKLNELRKNIVLSRKSLLEEDLKEKRQDLLSKLNVGDILTGRVKNITDFGVFIDLGGLDGLLHITDLSWGRVNHPKEVVKMDEELTVKVIDYDTEKSRVSLGLKQLTPHPWEGIEQKYPVDTVIKGKVVNIANYGVFIELEKGVEGLIHISEISWTQHIKHPSEIFALGQTVEAKVLSLDTEGRKISLGYKQLEPDPWNTMEEKYPINSNHKGIVGNIIPYGAFIQLEEGVDGFVHISDLSWTRKLRHPKDVLKKGKEIDVKILDISKENRKINVGLKQCQDDPWPLIEIDCAVGSIIEGEVIKVTDKVIVVKLDHGVSGIVPLGQIPKSDAKNVDDSIKVGAKMQLKVIELNKDEKRIVLSRTQAIPKKPKSDAEAYMMKQEEVSDKIEIPNAIIESIEKSEKTKDLKKKKTTAKKKVVEEKPVEESGEVKEDIKKEKDDKKAKAEPEVKKETTKKKVTTKKKATEKAEPKEEIKKDKPEVEPEKTDAEDKE